MRGTSHQLPFCPCTSLSLSVSFFLVFNLLFLFVHLHQESREINMRRCVRQGDTILPKLFTAAFESIFPCLPWETKGLKINGKYLSHLRLADDILICANTPHELQEMLQELADESENQGLKMTKSKIKVMMENDTLIYVTNTEIENVESHIYLGQRHSTRDKNQDKEIQRRIMAGWTTFAKHRDIFKGYIVTCLKRQECAEDTMAAH